MPNAQKALPGDRTLHAKPKRAPKHCRSLRDIVLFLSLLFFFFHGLPPSVRIIRFRLSQGTLDPSAAQSNLTQGLRRGGGRKSCKQALDSQSAFSTVQRSSYAADLLACLPAPREGLSGLDEASVVTLVDCWCFKSSAKPHAVLLNARSPQFFLG